jgi:hypothetical protein
MENRQSLLDTIWRMLTPLPRQKVNALLATLGFKKSMYAKLGDTEAKKLFLGLVTRLDDQALRSVVPMLERA